MSARSGFIAPAIFSILVLFLFGELSIRLLFSKYVGVTSDERNQLYRYDEELGWFPIQNCDKTYKGFRLIHTHHNNKGFRDVDHWKKKKPRIIFIGDSYVWGYDVEAEELFTELLKPQFPGWEILNLGVSGYGTDQELMLLERYIDEYDPEILFLIFCSKNDHFDNSVNVNYGGYYKPYYITEGTKLVRSGVPVPRSYNYYINQFPLLFKSYFIRGLFKVYARLALPERIVNDDPTEKILIAMKELVESRGAQFHIGLTDPEHDGEEISFLKDNDFNFIDLSNDSTYPIHRHWKPTGHQLASKLLVEYLKVAIAQTQYQAQRN